jgi:hypothetical protein
VGYAIRREEVVGAAKGVVIARHETLARGPSRCADAAEVQRSQ